MVACKCPENRLEMVLVSTGQGGGDLGPAAVLVVGLDAFFGSPKRRLASKKQRAFIHHHPCRLIYSQYCRLLQSLHLRLSSIATCSHGKPGVREPFLLNREEKLFPCGVLQKNKAFTSFPHHELFWLHFVLPFCHKRARRD